MNALTVIRSANARCALCGTESQYHGRGACQTFTPLPNATAWHQTPEVRAIIADMKMIDAMGRVLEARYAKTSVCFGFGELELATGRYGGAPRYQADGDVGQLLGLIETAREDAIDAERLRIYPASYSSHSDVFDDFADTLDGHFDSVVVAIGNSAS